MTSLRKIVLVGLVAAVGAMASPARAAIIYSYVTGQSSYTIAPNAQVTIPVYLSEALTSGSASLITTENGLFGAGWSVTQSGTLPASPSVLTSLDGSVTSNGSNFAGGSFTVKSGGSASFMAGDNITSLTASSGPLPNALHEILLGTITITGGLKAGTTNFVLDNFTYPLTTGGYTQTFETGYDLDPNSSNPAFTGTSSNPTTFAVTVGRIRAPYRLELRTSSNPTTFAVTVAVPEPASLGFLLVGGSLMMIRRSRKPAGCRQQQ